jgi:hypothetical protein
MTPCTLLQAIVQDEQEVSGKFDYEVYVCIIVDCKSLYDNGERSDGVYTISPPGGAPFPVICDMAHGGFSVVQRRHNGNVNFQRNYKEYTDGFGSLQGDFWLGLEKLHL